MTDTRDLLIEIGTEELPPKALKHLAVAFAEEIHNGLDNQNLKHGSHHWFATPRRLAVIVNKLVVKQSDHEQVRRGPALKAAYDSDGKPSKAAEGFAGSCNVDVKDLETIDTDNGGRLIFRSMQKGRSTADLLPEIINTALARLPIPKRMRWGNNDTEFVRPVHWSIVLLGREIVPCTILNTQSGNETRGHRFHHPKPLKITSASTYLKKLKEKAYVIADYEERKELIRTMVNDAASKCSGEAHIEGDLLDEVTSLVEWPVAITGTYDKEFLDLPFEVLLATMQDHQKYFPITDKNGQLQASFVTIANIDSKSPDEVKRGNERVIRPRLADATFFWQQDCTKSLVDYKDGLDKVIFQKDLGTLADKTERIRKLSVFIASELNLQHKTVARAATLAKCDLLTDMVGEFPKLQGIMGRYYAMQSKETEAVSIAIGEHYFPRFAGDNLPASETGRILAIADKIDNLVGIFAIGQTPTGEKDPYGLRRAALGCLRIMIECQLDLDLKTCLIFSAGTFDKKVKANTVTDSVFDFMMERLQKYYSDTGVTVDIFESVLQCRPTRPYDFHQRVKAVSDFTDLPEAESLAAANKRIHNILRQAGCEITPAIDGSLSVEDAEKDLVKKLDDVTRKVAPLTRGGNYTEALKELSGLRDSIDNFFDNVMVMVDDDNLRIARLQLLATIRHEFTQIADISRLQ